MRRCTSSAPSSKSIATILRVVVPRTIESSTTIDALAGHLAERVELRLDPALAQRLVRLDEGAADVAVLDQALGERDPGGAREADRGGRARVRHGHDEVRLDGRLGGKPLAHPHPRAVQLDAAELRVGPREVDELEDAERAGPAGLDRLLRLVARLVHDHHLAGRELPLDLGAEEVERAGLGREEPVVLEPAKDERTDPVRVAEARRAFPRREGPRRTRPRSGPSRRRPPLRAGARRGRSGPRSPRCPRWSEGARRRRGGPSGARSCS